jgi:hypothetical protein
MLAVFKRRTTDRSEEILDLTAPAVAGEGIVQRWLRDTLERGATEKDSGGPGRQ